MEAGSGTVPVIVKTFEPALRGGVLSAKAAAAAGQKMPDRHRTRIEFAFMAGLGASWIAAATILALWGHADQIVYISGVALTFVTVARTFLKQEKREEKAEADRREIKETVIETKTDAAEARSHAREAADRVNGVTTQAMDELRAKHEKDIEALKEQHANAIRALEERARADRHKHDGALQALTLELDMANAALAKMTEEKGRLEGRLIECEKQIAACKAKGGGGEGI